MCESLIFHAFVSYIVVTESEIHILDVAAKVDSKAAPLCKEHWGPLQFAPSLCRDLHPEVCVLFCRDPTGSFQNHTFSKERKYMVLPQT